MHPRHAEHLEAPDGSHDVEDRIDRADLVQVDFLGGHSVDLPLGARDRAERFVRPSLHALRHRGLGDQRADLADAATVRLRRNLEVHLDAGDVAAAHVPDLDADTVEPEARRKRAQPVRLETAGDERAERHVAGDAAERVEDRDGHVDSVGGSRGVSRGTTRRCRC
jgi:hypothetical protein